MQSISVITHTVSSHLYTVCYQQLSPDLKIFHILLLEGQPYNWFCIKTNFEQTYMCIITRIHMKLDLNICLDSSITICRNLIIAVIHVQMHVYSIILENKMIFSTRILNNFECQILFSVVY